MIVGVTGHQSLPPAVAMTIAGEISSTLRDSGPALTGVSSLAAGADQLFAHAVLQLGGRLHVIVPCSDYESAFADEAARAAYSRLLDKADVVETLPHAQPSAAAFFEAGRRIVDMAELLIAIWDGELPNGAGGTADIVRYARERGSRMIVIWPKGAKR